MEKSVNKVNDRPSRRHGADIVECSSRVDPKTLLMEEKRVADDNIDFDVVQKGGNHSVPIYGGASRDKSHLARR